VLCLKGKWNEVRVMNGKELLATVVGLGFGAFSLWYIAKDFTCRKPAARQADPNAPTLAAFRTPDTDARLNELADRVDVAKHE
jgi:hypothetical protein